MKFAKTSLQGVFVVDIEPHTDERGFFARTWCAKEFAQQGLCERMVQGSISHSKKAGTLRGLHLHAEQFPQARLVNVIRGSAFFAMVDLRPASETYLQHVTHTTQADDYRAFYTPPGIALGYQTLMDDTLIYYLMPQFYAPEHERGVRWDDPAFAIRWPDAQRIIIERDANYPDYEPTSPPGAR